MPIHLLLKKYQTPLLLLIVGALSLFVRLYHYPQIVNFSTDQALFSLKAWEIWHTGKQTLIGPTFSVNVDGRYAFQGPAIYYLQLLFLLAGNWDPLLSSALFTIFAVVMIVPLFFGVSWLMNKKAACIMVFSYAFFPVYIQYSRFLWNPNYQLALFPLAIWLMGKYAKTQSQKYFFFLAIMLGILLQFHYQFILVIGGIFIYYVLSKQLSWLRLGLWTLGLAIGFSPLIFFELRHQFYNSQTLLMFIQTILVNRSSQAVGVGLTTHYVLSVSFAFLLMMSAFLSRKIPNIIFVVLGVMLISWSILITLRSPTHAFGAPASWNYLKEQTAAQVIHEQHLAQFQVINLIYDTQAAVQKYLSLKVGVPLDNNYQDDEFLFVLGTDRNLAETQAYEFTTFSPRQLQQVWRLDENGHQLFLFRRSK